MSSIFRQKSLDKINNPEELDKYMRVTNPPVWFALIAITLVLVGAIIWACTATIETKVDALVKSDGTNTTCYVSEQYISNVNNDTVIKINGKGYKITSIEQNTVLVSTLSLPDYQKEIGNLSDNDNVYVVHLDASLNSGSYQGGVVIEEVSPISFLFNGD